MEKILPKFPIYLSGLGAVSFFAAFVFENGYFFAVRYELIRLLSFSDYLENGIIWLPVMALPAFLGAYLRFGDQLYAERIRAEQNQNTIDSARASFFDNSDWLLLGLMGFILALFVIGFESPLRELGIVMIIAFGFLILMRFLLKTSDTLEYFNPQIRSKIKRSVAIITTFVTLCFTYGYGHGLNDIHATSSRLFFAETERKPVILLRSINRGYLVKDIVTHSVLFLSPDGERIAQYQIKITDRRSYLCRWFSFKCDRFRSNRPKDAAP